MYLCTKKQMGIRWFTVIVILIAAVITVIVVLRGNEDKREFTEKLEEDIRCCRMLTYRDSFYDYTVNYPSFFEQVPDSLLDEPGSSLFRYWDNWVQIEMSARVLPLSAVQQHADTFIDSGQLRINGSPIPDYLFHAKYIRKHKLWMVLMLTYPESCSQAVSRLINEVESWKGVE